MASKIKMHYSNRRATCHHFLYNQKAKRLVKTKTNISSIDVILIAEGKATQFIIKPKVK